MKKNLLFPILMLAALFVNAQITITSNDLPSTGQTFRTSISFELGSYNFEETGANYTWDFSDLGSMMQRQSTYVPVTQVPIIFWPFFLGSANQATEIEEFNLIPELPIDGGYQFYNKTAAQYADIGIGLNLGGLPIPLKFDNPDVLYKFPMSVGYTDVSNSDLSFTLPDVAHITVERTRISEVDGWGTLTTPYGTFQTIRLKSHVFEYDSIYLDTLGVPLVFNREYIEYKWFGNGHGLPLLVATDDEFIGASITYIDSLRIIPPSNFAAMPASDSQIDLEWSLNLSGDQVLLAWSADDIFGSPSGNYNIGDQIAGGGEVLLMGSGTSYNHLSLNSGTTYYYRIWSKSGNTYSSGIAAQATTLPGDTIPGDSNCDGIVNVLDVVITVNYILGANPEPFCQENADVNSDGLINVLDVVLTVDIILNSK